MSDKVSSEIPAEVKSEVKSEPPKSPGEVKNEESPFIDNTRKDVEDAVQKANETFPEPEADESTDPKESPKSEEKVEVKPPTEETLESKVKQKIQKRIDKEVAKRKTLEEELAETKAELESLKTQVKPKAETPADTKREPTDAEIRSALIKAKQDGDYEFEVQILEYMAERKAKAERTAALKEIEDRNKKVSDEQAQMQSEWNKLILDYVKYDDKGGVDNTHEMNLNNQNGLLYKTALALYKDPELQKSHYNDANKVMGFRRAVADAYREIMENGLLKQEGPARTGGEESPKTESRKRAQLAEPGAETHEVEVPPARNLSDAEKVVDEIRARKKFQNERSFA